MIKIWLPVCLIIVGTWSSIYCSQVVVYAHGLGSNVERMKSRVIDHVFPGVPSYGKNGPESTTYSFNRKKACFAQQADVDVLLLACQEALDRGMGPDIIGFGFSKGAATWLNMLGYLSASNDENHKQLLSHIKAVVVLAPFADLFEPEMLLYLFRKFRFIAQRCTLPNLFGVGRRAMTKLLSAVCPAYDPKGMCPIISAAMIAPTIPILIAHSVDDEIIPINQSRDLYEQLINNEQRSLQKNTYLFEFDGFKHRPSSRDATLWHKPVYAFLSHYNILPPELIAVDCSYNVADLCPDFLEIKLRRLRNTVFPSLAYGFILALGLEACKYCHHKALLPGKYHTSFKQSLLYGAFFGASCELLSWCKKKKYTHAAS